MKTTQLREVNFGKQAVRRLLNKVRKLLDKNYYSAKAYNHFLLWFSNLRSTGSQEQLVLYQMGKVGSTTILKSLEALKLNVVIYRVHFLTQDGIDRVEKDCVDNWYKFPYATHVWTSQFLRKQIDKGLKGRKWKIVTLTRDPIAKNISGFFQHLNRQSDFDYEQKINSAMVEDTPEELINIFLGKFPNHEVPLTWFDSELKSVFGIDVFSSDFPKSKGYKIYEGKHADVLLLKLEKLNECASKAFKEFLGLKEFTLIKGKNIASKKDYSIVYKKFKDSIILPDSYINKMYSSKYTQHFYSEVEIDAFKAKWYKGRA